MGRVYLQYGYDFLDWLLFLSKGDALFERTLAQCTKQIYLGQQLWIIIAEYFGIILINEFLIELEISVFFTHFHHQLSFIPDEYFKLQLQV